MSDSNARSDAPAAGLLAFALVALLTALVYLPGLSGPFVFDDFGTLSRLGDLGGIDDRETFLAFVLGGDSGPTGRPLALLSFLLDGSDWPTDSLPFKRTNLLIHLACGLLLYRLTAALLRWLSYQPARARRLALAAAALWLLHPLLVSTTLYAVQRMAQLATLFTFAGLALYLHGRRLTATRPVAAYAWMTAGVGGCTVLAVLSKENGALLPLLAGVLEITVVAARPAGPPRLNRIWAALFIALPSALLFAYLGRYVADAGLFTVNSARGYSIYERLLTEGRVLGDYLLEWFLPSPYTSGVFQDHLRHSTGWLEPPSTLVAALVHLSAVVAALWWRRRLPIAAFGVLFFYTAHLLESTVVNLELYFEHRNYLAAAFLFLPLLQLAEQKLKPRAFVAVAAAFGLLVAAFTASQAIAWRSYPTLVEAAVVAEPDSARAQQQYALQLFNRGEPDAALAAIDAAIERLPGRDSLYLTRVLLRCRTGSAGSRDTDELRRTIGRRPWDLRLLGTQEMLFDLVVSNACPGISVADLNGVYEAMLEVPANSDPRSVHFFQLQYFLALADLAMDDLGDAVVHFRASLASRPTASRAMLMASLLANAEHYDEAMTFTHEALRLAAAGADAPLSASHVDAAEIRAFQERLRAAAATP